MHDNQLYVIHEKYDTQIDLIILHSIEFLHIYATVSRYCLIALLTFHGLMGRAFPHGRWAWLDGPLVDESERGWVWLQGFWSWGLVLSWHYQAWLGREGLAYLVATVWWWDSLEQSWRKYQPEIECSLIALPQSEQWKVHQRFWP